MTEYKESSYEAACEQLFANELGYDVVHGSHAASDAGRNRQALLLKPLAEAIRRINPDLPEAGVQTAVQMLQDLTKADGGLKRNNAVFMRWMQRGVKVEWRNEDGELQVAIVRFIAFDRPELNSFVIARQWPFSEMRSSGVNAKRMDLVVFVNGIPLAVIELKSPTREGVDVSDAYAQLQTYMSAIPAFFICNAILAVSDQAVSRAGTITAPENRFAEWKSLDGDYGKSDERQAGRFDVFFKGMFEKRRFLDILQNFILYDESGSLPSKKLASYHQYFAVRKAVKATLDAILRGDGRIGVIWHTQGSGKSLSCVFYVHLLLQENPEITIVIVTDRNELDDQLFGAFMGCQRFLGQEPVQAQSRAELRELLNGRKMGGIVFTTLQKFDQMDEPFSRRRNIVVIADEAHRSHYSLEERFDSEGRPRFGEARLLRDALPNASFIGFTGTPISAKDRSTTEVFGSYIDVYDMTQAVEDGATVPIYYESRAVNLGLDAKSLAEIDRAYESLDAEADGVVIETSKNQLSSLERLLSSDTVIENFVMDVLTHYETCRIHLPANKAMIVAFSRSAAMKIYEKMLEKRSDMADRIAVVMTAGSADPEAWHSVIGDKAYRQELARRFKNPDDPLKIAIVVDMWLTGFDVLPLSTMYMFKFMRGHALMQAVARVNRVFKGKAGGLIVDYAGIAAALKDAMSVYSVRDRSRYAGMNVADKVYAAFQEKLLFCRRCMQPFQYGAFLDEGCSEMERARLISGGMNALLAKGKKEERNGTPEKQRTTALFLHAAAKLRDTLSLCSTVAAKPERIEAAFFEACRVMLVKTAYAGGDEGRLSLQDINKCISELLKQTVSCKGIVNLFSGVDVTLDLFNPETLKKIAAMPEKNLAYEILKKLLDDKIRKYRGINMVKAQQFSERFQKVLEGYINGMAANEKVIKNLLDIADDIYNCESNPQRNKFENEYEKAYYDILETVQPSGNSQNSNLVQVTHELIDVLKKCQTTDWQKQDISLATMRRDIKHLLAEHGYSIESIGKIVPAVIEQCKLQADMLSA